MSEFCPANFGIFPPNFFKGSKTIPYNQGPVEILHLSWKFQMKIFKNKKAFWWNQLSDYREQRYGQFFALVFTFQLILSYRLRRICCSYKVDLIQKVDIWLIYGLKSIKFGAFSWNLVRFPEIWCVFLKFGAYAQKWHMVFGS